MKLYTASQCRELLRSEAELRSPALRWIDNDCEGIRQIQSLREARTANMEILTAFWQHGEITEKQARVGLYVLREKAGEIYRGL